MGYRVGLDSCTQPVARYAEYLELALPGEALRLAKLACNTRQGADADGALAHRASLPKQEYDHDMHGLVLFSLEHDLCLLRFHGAKVDDSEYLVSPLDEISDPRAVQSVSHWAGLAGCDSQPNTAHTPRDHGGGPCMIPCDAYRRAKNLSAQADHNHHFSRFG